MTIKDLSILSQLIADNTDSKDDMEISIKVPSYDLEAIDMELYRMTPQQGKFKHTKTVIATINGIKFKLEEKDMSD